MAGLRELPKPTSPPWRRFPQKELHRPPAVYPHHRRKPRWQAKPQGRNVSPAGSCTSSSTASSRAAVTGRAARLRVGGRAIAIALEEAGASRYERGRPNRRNLCRADKKEAQGRTGQQEREG